jgi:hypothetical protein
MNGLLTFEASISPKPTKGEDGTFTATVTTQSRIPKHFRMPDGSYIDELLLMKGAKLPADGKVSLVDSHDYSTVKSVLGSVRLEMDDDHMTGTLSVSSSEPTTRTKIEEGHISSVSVGMRPDKSNYVPAGKNKTYAGVSYEGPLMVYESWTPYEVSLTSVPANENAKIQLSLINNCEPLNGEELIPPGVRMADKDKDCKEALKHDDDVLDDRKEQDEEDEEEDDETNDEEKKHAIEQAAIAKYSKFRADVVKEAKRFKLSESVVEEIVSKANVNFDKARLLMLDQLAGKQEKPHITVGSDGCDRQFDAQQAAVTYRFIQSQGMVQEFSKLTDPKTGEKVVPNVDKLDPMFRNMPLAKHAEMQLEAQGYNCRYWATDDIVKAGLWGTFNMPHLRRFGQDAPISTTGGLSHLLSDAINKVALGGFLSAPVSFNIVFAQIPSVSNLHKVPLINDSGLGYLDARPEGMDPLQKYVTDSEEDIKMQMWSNRIIFPPQVIMNDDLGRLAATPMKWGRAAARTVNRECWSVIINNQVMQTDSVALFNSAHNNYVQTGNGNSGAPSTANVNAMTSLLATQTDLDGAIIGQSGKYLVGPPSLERNIKQICLGDYDPTASEFLAVNPFNTLTPVIEPLLQANSTTAYYLFTDKQESAVAYCFYSGQETPFIRTWQRPESNDLVVYVEQTFGTAARDYRRAVKNDGV